MRPGVRGAFARWSKAFLNWTPHPAQARAADSMARRGLLVTGSRWGKSEFVAAFFLWLMFWNAGHRYLNCSISQDQANLVLNKALGFAQREPMRFFVDWEACVVSPFPKIVLKNGAELWVRSTVKNCAFIRGHSFHGINYDECAYGKETDLDVLLLRIADYDGFLWLTTTPKGKNWVYATFVQWGEARKAGSPEHFVHTGPTHENPYIPARALDALSRGDDRRYRQEVLGEFVEVEGATFPYWVIEKIFQEYEPETEPLKDKDGRDAARYLCSWDFGRKTTLTVGHTFDIASKIRGVDRVRLFSAPWPKVYAEVERLENHWDASTIGDGTGVGDVVFQSVNVTMVPFIFTPKSRAMLITEAQETTQTPDAVVLPVDWVELRTDMILHTWKEDAEGRTWDDLDSFLLGVHQANNLTKRGPSFYYA